MMILALSEQAQETLGKTELVVITERVDDVALLLAQMISTWACPRFSTSICRVTGSQKA